ncbi:unnamed protein product, partial [Musa textilis]
GISVSSQTKDQNRSLTTQCVFARRERPKKDKLRRTLYLPIVMRRAAAAAAAA